MSTPTTAGARRSVATYSTYRDAERAVDRLSDAGFPVEHVAIVGSGLRTVEQVTRRMTTGRAALMGAGQGAVIGVFFALLFGLFFTGPSFLGLLIYAVVLSAFFGAFFGALGQAATGGRRDFASFQRMEAERYEVVVDADHAERATQLLENRSPQPGSPADPGEPDASADPGEPDAPADPGEPDAPADSRTPDAPADSRTPDAPADPRKPDAPAGA